MVGVINEVLTRFVEPLEPNNGDILIEHRIKDILRNKTIREKFWGNKE